MRKSGSYLMNADTPRDTFAGVIRGHSVGKPWERWAWVALFAALTILGVRTAILFMYDNSINTTDTHSWDQKWNLVHAGAP
jgi:hypothetical protein